MIHKGKDAIILVIIHPQKHLQQYAIPGEQSRVAYFHKAPHADHTGM